MPEGPFRQGQPFCVRSGGLVLALRGRGLAGPVPVRVRAVSAATGSAKQNEGRRCRPFVFQAGGWVVAAQTLGLGRGCTQGFRFARSHNARVCAVATRSFA
ncbi:hypothetical protein [Lysobacter gummosus]|uniref:hypothetical protein n=1 Tax=Lysobacter gummosus TaxID=262324 RepID=UPI003628282C